MTVILHDPWLIKSVMCVIMSYGHLAVVKSIEVSNLKIYVEGFDPSNLYSSSRYVSEISSLLLLKFNVTATLHAFGSKKN